MSRITEMNIFELQITFDVVWFMSSLWKTVNFRVLNKTKFNGYSIIAFLRNMLQQFQNQDPKKHIPFTWVRTQVEDCICVCVCVLVCVCMFVFMCLRKYSFSENRSFLKSI